MENVFLGVETGPEWNNSHGHWNSGNNRKFPDLKKKKVLKQIEILKSYINFEFLVLLSC